ncbi:MAG: GtrA family protein [Dokdonella sp.]|uniref:GtrA family protein n=1 Tax=Dokdonella sp. TaxID=2291710 RepID=UPI00326681E3
MAGQTPPTQSRRADTATRSGATGGEVLRFLIMGGVNTATTYALSLLLMHWMRYEFAYSIGYVAGIVMAYALSTTFVFRRPMRARSAARFPLVYVLQFVLSIALLHTAVDVIGVPRWLALGLSIAVTMPITFVMSRWVLRSA